MAKYETMLITSAALDEEATAALVGKFKSLIEANGTIDSIDEWGNKQWLLKEPKALAPHAPCVAAARRFAASVSIVSTPSITRTCPVCVSTSLSVQRSFPAV